MVTLYTNKICPFAHRAAFALELRPAEDAVKKEAVPLAGQITWAGKRGVETMPVNEPFLGLTAEGLATAKDEYKKTINSSGEVPSLKLASGDIVVESEIVAEYIDATSNSEKGRLMPEDPVKASKVRLVMKRFNDVIAPGYTLLMNQDPSKDAEIAEKLNGTLAKFETALDNESGFCVGTTVTLADVHCAPFLHRFNILLPHYRGHDMLASFPRLSKLLGAVEALPEFQADNIAGEEFITIYGIYAHAQKWSEDGLTFAGRGKSEFGK